MDTGIRHLVGRQDAPGRHRPIGILLATFLIVAAIASFLPAAPRGAVAGPVIPIISADTYQSTRSCDPFAAFCTEIATPDYGNARISGSGFTPGGAVIVEFVMPPLSMTVKSVTVSANPAISMLMLFGGRFVLETDYLIDPVDCASMHTAFNLLVRAQDVTTGNWSSEILLKACN